MAATMGRHIIDKPKSAMNTFLATLSYFFHPHDPNLVVLAFALAVSASYVSLELAGRIKASTGRARVSWLGASAVAMGGGIWSMHFVAMLGLLLPVPGKYDTALTVLSLVVAVLGAGAGFYLVFWRGQTHSRFLRAGAVMGLAVVAMHYIGMAALEVPAAVSFDPPLVALSVVIAIAASCVALWLAFTLEHFALKLVSSFIMAVAVAGMHFTGMAAFLCVAPAGEEGPLAAIYSANMAMGVIVTAGAILLTGFVLAQRDRHVRETQLTQSVRRNQKHLERAQRISRTGSIEVDLQTGEATWSDEILRIFGFDNGPPPNRLADLFARLHADDRDKLTRVFEAARAGHWLRSFECRVTHPDGTERLVYHDADIVLDDDGKPITQISILRDITELRVAQSRQKELEQELLQAQKIEALGTMAGGIAHELNTPIQFITDNTNFLATAFRDMGEAVGDYRKLVPAEADAAIAKKCDLEFIGTEVPQAISQTLEGLSRVAEIVLAIKRFLHPSSTVMEENNLNDIVKTTTVVTKNQWKYVADLDLDLDPNLPTVKSNAGELNQVFLNLIVNAAHAIEDKGAKDGKGHITIRTRQTAEGVECSVSDTGVGIKGVNRSKIFDLFFTTKAPGRGTGQGLSLVHTIVTQSHKGKIAVDSTPGIGTTFTLTFPLAT